MLRQSARAGEFIMSERENSRSIAALAAGQNLAAGTLLAKNDDDDLIAWSSGDCVGILYAGVNAVTRTPAVFVAREASVNFQLLIFGDAAESDARDAVEALGSPVLSTIMA